MQGAPASPAGLLAAGMTRFSLRASHHQATARPTPSIEPGKMPARNSLEIDSAAGDAEHDEADAGRDDRPDDAGCGDQARRARLVVAGLDHHRHQQRRERRGIGHGRAGQGREDAGGHDGDVAEAALTWPISASARLTIRLRQAAGVHDLAGQHEERHRHQREAVGAVDDVLGDDLRVEQVQLHISATPQTSSA